MWSRSIPTPVLPTFQKYDKRGPSRLRPGHIQGEKIRRLSPIAVSNHLSNVSSHSSSHRWPCSISITIANLQCHLHESWWTLYRLSFDVCCFVWIAMWLISWHHFSSLLCCLSIFRQVSQIPIAWFPTLPRRLIYEAREQQCSSGSFLFVGVIQLLHEFLKLIKSY